MLTLSTNHKPTWLLSPQQPILAHSLNNPYILTLSTIQTCSLSQQSIHVHPLNNPYVLTLSTTHRPTSLNDPYAFLLTLSTILTLTCLLSQQFIHAHSLTNPYMLTLNIHVHPLNNPYANKLTLPKAHSCSLSQESIGLDLDSINKP